MTLEIMARILHDYAQPGAPLFSECQRIQEMIDFLETVKGEK